MKNRRIVGAFVIGTALVVGAYTVSNFGESKQHVAARGNIDPDAGLVVGQAPIRPYIGTKDQNNDGVPDWQEALRNTEPIYLEEIETETYEIPDTVTDQFAVNFFESYVRAKGFGAFGGTQEDVIEKNLRELEVAAQDELIGPEAVDAVITPTPDNLRTYGNAIARILLSGEVSSEEKAL